MTHFPRRWCICLLVASWWWLGSLPLHASEHDPASDGVTSEERVAEITLESDEGQIMPAPGDSIRGGETPRESESIEPYSPELYEVHTLQDPAPVPASPQTFGVSPSGSLASQEITDRLFSEPGQSRSLLSENRRRAARQPGTNVVFGDESRLRASTDAGSLLESSSSGIGLGGQRRTPIITDPKIRSSNVGQLVASGSYWFPVRQDLDTLLSKLDSRIIDDMIVIKGPYSSRYGPGYNFIDIQLLESPRYADGPEWHSSTSVEYKTNGEQFYGRETVWGGNADYGFRVGYGHRTANNYHDGAGIEYPTSYKSRDVDVALGFDLSDTSSIEFSYLRLDQTDVEIPGQVFDLDYLGTDAFEVTFREQDLIADYLEIEGWYNASRLHGNAQGAGKRQQMPILDSAGFVGNTNANNYSTGFKFELNWGDEGDIRRTLGADMRYLRQALNEYDLATDPAFIFPPNTLINFPIPPALQANPGVFAEIEVPVTADWNVRGGGRLDWVHSEAVTVLPGTLSAMSGSNFEDDSFGSFNQSFHLIQGFLTSEYALNEVWTASAGGGYGMRPPTMTEMYAQSPFLAVLPQFAFTSPRGNPNLLPEKRWQVDLGLEADYGNVRTGVNAFHAWIEDYITLDFVSPPDGFNYRWTNSPRAIMSGVEWHGEHDVQPFWTNFGTLFYTQGRDLTRDQNGFFSPDVIPGFPAFLAQPRSNSLSGSTLATGTKEPMPTILPLEARTGFRLHDPSPDNVWGVEFLARIVNAQNLVATSLGEQTTAGFYTLNVHSYAKLTQRLNVFSGVQNLTDNKYREHLDARIFTNPVFQPGVNFYFGTEFVQ